MKRIMMMLALAALTVVALSASAFPAFAAQCPNGERAENIGGGFKQCEQPGKNRNFSKTQTQKGSFQSSHPLEEECNRPGNAPQCPPGQFR